MAIRNKKVLEHFYKNNSVPEESKNSESPEQSQYSQFKSLEKDLVQVLEAKGSFATVLNQHISFTNPKKQLISLISEIFSTSSSLELIESKQLDERFWVLLKKELRRSKLEKRSKPQLSASYLENIQKNKEAIAGIIKQAWPVLEPLKDPHFHDSFVRKLFGRLFMSLGEVLKQKSKADKSVLSEVKEFYMRSNKVFGFSPRCQELLGMVHQALGDLFGAVYWFTRSLCLPNPAATKERLVAVYEELRCKWEKHSMMTKVSNQPVWHVSFCLSFLRIQGIFLTGVNTENLQFLFKLCSDHMDVFLSKNDAGNLLVSMVVIWIFSVHISQNSVSALPDLLNHDPSIFDHLIGQTPQVLDLFSQFIQKLLQNFKHPESPWLSPLLIFLYWLISYKSVRKHFFACASFKTELSRAAGMIPEDLKANCHLLLPEDLSIIGFLPLHYFYIGHKDFYNLQAQQSEEIVIRMKSFKDLAEEILENCESEEEKENNDDEFFGLSSANHGFDFSGLTFDENVKKLVVVDGPNVAVRHGNGNFSCKGLRIVLNYFSSKGFEVKIVVPEQFLLEDRAEELKFRGAKGHKIPVGLQILKDIDSQGFLIKTPPMDYDDSYCLQYAKTKNGFVVSNDRFWDHIKKHPEAKDWIREKTCSFTFAGDDFLPNPDFEFV